MPIDFRPLSMTELRTRPGEILDRVADKGESFIIERGGQQKACLVPLSVFAPDISPSRIAAEFEELAKHGESPAAMFTESNELAFRFAASPDDPGAIEIKVLLPHGYPHTCPRVYAESVQKDAPHRWKDGALCLYGVMSGWNPGKDTVFSTLELARRWLSQYRAWKDSGQWPINRETSDE